jgi:hypothetical protein
MYLHNLDLSRTDLDITEGDRPTFLVILDLARMEVGGTEVGTTEV